MSLPATVLPGIEPDVSKPVLHPRIALGLLLGVLLGALMWGGAYLLLRVLMEALWR